MIKFLKSRKSILILSPIIIIGLVVIAILLFSGIHNLGLKKEAENLTNVSKEKAVEQKQSIKDVTYTNHDVIVVLDNDEKLNNNHLKHFDKHLLKKDNDIRYKSYTRYYVDIDSNPAQPEIKSKKIVDITGVINNN